MSKRRQWSHTRRDEGVGGFGTVFDPLFCLSGVRLPRHAVRVRFCSHGHQVWDLAFRDERVTSHRDNRDQKKAGRPVAYQQVA